MSTQRAPVGAHIPVWTRGDRLRKARIDAGLSQQALADETSISKRQIIYYENDEKVPTRGDYLLWQLKTGVPASWLETGMDNTARNPDGGPSGAPNPNSGDARGLRYLVGPTRLERVTSTVECGRFAPVAPLRRAA